MIETSPHILFVLPTLSAGGAERVVSILANHWASKGRRVDIATFEPAAMKPFYAIDRRIALHRLDLPPVSSPKWRAILRTAVRIRALRLLYRRVRPDVVISFLTKTNIMAIAAAAGARVPVIISERNNPAEQRFDRFWNLARAVAFPHAYSFVTMTERAASYYPKLQRPRTRIIPNPVAPLSLRNTKFGVGVLAAVGRLTAQKRFDRLIDAFARIAPEFPQWRLVIWGEGELRKQLEQQRDALGLRERIALPGLTNSPGQWAESADIVVLSSDYEGWPNVLVEALSVGIPVVAVDCDFGPKEILEDGACGLLAAKDDPESLSRALAQMMQDEGLRRLCSERGLARAEKFAPAAIAAQWDDLISEAIAERSRHQR